MASFVSQLRQAWRLYRTESRLDTLAAVLIVVTVLGPIVYQLYRLNKSIKRTPNSRRL